jgi:hypothetical protein
MMTLSCDAKVIRLGSQSPTAATTTASTANITSKKTTTAKTSATTAAAAKSGARIVNIASGAVGLLGFWVLFL